jgi:hypothetical protein
MLHSHFSGSPGVHGVLIRHRQLQRGRSRLTRLMSLRWVFQLWLWLACFFHLSQPLPLQIGRSGDQAGVRPSSCKSGGAAAKQRP